MGDYPAVLLVNVDYGKYRQGISAINRQLGETLTTVIAVFCAVLEATEEDKKDAKHDGVELLLPKLYPGDFRTDPSVDWLTFDHKTKFPHLPSKSKVKCIVGHADVTSRAAVRIKQERYPAAKVILINHDIPEDTDQCHLQSAEREDAILEDAQEADVVFSVGTKIFDHFENQFRAIPTDKQPLHFKFLPRPCEIFETAKAVYKETDTKVVLSIQGGVEGHNLVESAMKIVAKTRSVKLRIIENFQTTQPKNSESIFLPFGTQKDICKYMMQAHLVLLLSCTEPFGLVGLDAIAAGVPVLLSGKSGLADFILEYLHVDDLRHSIFDIDESDQNATVTYLAKSIEKMLKHNKTEFETAARCKEKILSTKYWEESHQRFIKECTDAGNNTKQPVEVQTTQRGTAIQETDEELKSFKSDNEDVDMEIPAVTGPLASYKYPHPHSTEGGTEAEASKCETETIAEVYTGPTKEVLYEKAPDNQYIPTRKHLSDSDNSEQERMEQDSTSQDGPTASAEVVMLLGKAAANVPREEFDKRLLACSSCQNIIDNPRILPCHHHTFCAGCLEGWRKDKSEFTCPTCPQQVSNIQQKSRPVPVQMAKKTEENVDNVKHGKISRLARTKDKTDGLNVTVKEERAELKKTWDIQATAPARRLSGQVSNIQQRSGPKHVEMADKTGLPTEEEVGKMKYHQLTQLLQDLGMTKEETDWMFPEVARAKVKRRIRDMQAARRRPGQAGENLTETLDKHNSKRERLAELCHSIVASYLPMLDRTHRSIKEKLKAQFGREVKDILKEVQGHLDSEECPILVAGKTSSGKSTFLNLLLGEEILPVSVLSCTSTICELKYGEPKHAVVHLRQPNDQGKEQITIPLDGTEEHRKKLESYIHLRGASSRDSLPPAEMIEIFCPLPLLEGGIVLVDSPSVGESEMMDKVVAEYIPKCFAFLHIIDSSRAGGVQQDRWLGELLKLHATKENAEDYDPESAMFICNKWDQVPAEERDEVKSDTFRKLSQMWQGLKEEQVFFVSTREAVGPGGILSADFTKVLDGLDLLLPKSLDIKLETQYRLLTRLSSAALTHIDVQLNVARQNLDQEGKVQKYREAKDHLQLFQQEAQQNMQELESMVRNNIKTTKDFLSDLVETGKLKDLILGRAYVLEDLQKTKKQSGETRFSKLYEQLAAPGPCFVEYIRPMDESFERKTKEVVGSLENAYQQTMRVSSNNPNFSGGPMQETLRVHDVLYSRPLGSFQQRVRQRFRYMFHGHSRSLPHKLARWGKGIVKAVLESQSKTKSVLQSYWKQASADTPLIDILMQALKTEEVLTDLAERQIKPQHDLMALLEADITKMTTVLEQTIDYTFKDTRSNEEILQTYEPQSRDINSFLGQLAMFHLTSTMRYKYDLDSIPGWEYTTNRIGGGSFGEVYRVRVQWEGVEIPAALKIGVYPYDITTTETAWEFLKEEGNLWKLKGERIVEYYGTACRKERHGLRLGLVMELCEGTLEDRIVGNKDQNPAWWGSDPEKQTAAFSYTQNLAVQLCEGLKHIHGEGYIHRDLKLINVLVTRDNTVKLADVGLTKREESITGTIAGTPLYAAPEVKERKLYDKSADIYSLGLILWEMWYGRTLYGLEDEVYSKRLKEDLKRGRDIRMPRWEGSVPPIPEWTSLIHDCLKKDPKKRPQVQECLDRISAMKV